VVTRGISRFFMASALLILAFPLRGEAQNLGCRLIGIGCPTAADRQRALERCDIQSRREYQHFLSDAIADPSLWRLQGDRSAQAYATRRARSWHQICIETSPELRR